MAARNLLQAADLFCGAGGTSMGLARAANRLERRLELTAVNHWPVAVSTHAANHPAARHLCETLDQVDPRKLFCEGKLDLLVASPECVHHSIARGGKPVNDQSRATAWHVVRWADALRPRAILVENVREFQSWGPIGSQGKPLPSKRGETFAAWLQALRSLGYRTDYRILNCADYGDATTRERLFVQAVRGRQPIRWPEASHSATGEATLFGQLPRWRAARDIIDWTCKGQSIFSRKRPLSANTLKRIEAGLRRFGGEAFALSLREGIERRLVPLERPLPTIAGGSSTGTGGALGLCEPFVLGQQSGSVARPTREPIPTVATGGAISLIEPFTIHLTHQGGDRVNSLGQPLPTITTARRGEQALIEPFVISARGTRTDQLDNARGSDSPLATVSAGGVHAGLVEPYLVKFYGQGEGVASVADPLDTVTTKDRFGLVTPLGILDILFRMLKVHELAAAHSFPSTYVFKGTGADQVKQVGNSVPVRTSEALCYALLAG